MPVSEAQLAANRANAAKSTGPRTPEGKARSSQNARTHGFTASTFAAASPEELHELARLNRDLLAVYQPVNSPELLALEQIALAQQTIFRAARLESVIFTACPGKAARIRNYALPGGLHRLARSRNAFSLLLRYKVRTERLYRRAIEQFDRLKSQRPKFPNERG